MHGPNNEKNLTIVRLWQLKSGAKNVQGMAININVKLGIIHGNVDYKNRALVGLKKLIMMAPSWISADGAKNLQISTGLYTRY